MKNWLSSQGLFIARILIGILFFLSGFSKLTQPIEYFQLSISFFEVFPDTMIPWVAHIVPWIEIITATYLLAGFRTRETAAILALLCFSFQVILGQALIRRLEVEDCGCFGGGFHLSLYQSFALDTVLVLILLRIALSEKMILSLDNKLT